MTFKQKQSYGIEDLREIMRVLRSESGCPWDREQTHASIRKDSIEETYEAIEAIDQNDPAMLREELGDVLLQIVFHTQMEEEAGTFSFDDVVDEICKKLIIRHPHVFGDAQVSDVSDVLDQWTRIKQETKGQTTASETLDAVPKQLPALMRAQKVQGRAKKAGFDYPDVTMAFDDLKSEVIELSAAMDAQDADNIKEELGDVLFAAVNVARLCGEDAEETLTGSCNKFIARFKHVEALAAAEQVDSKTASIETLLTLWKKAKQL